MAEDKLSIGAAWSDFLPPESGQYSGRLLLTNIEMLVELFMTRKRSQGWIIQIWIQTLCLALTNSLAFGKLHILTSLGFLICEVGG